MNVSLLIDLRVETVDVTLSSVRDQPEDETPQDGQFYPEDEPDGDREDAERRGNYPCDDCQENRNPTTVKTGPNMLPNPSPDQILSVLASNATSMHI